MLDVCQYLGNIMVIEICLKALSEMQKNESDQNLTVVSPNKPQCCSYQLDYMLCTKLFFQ